MNILISFPDVRQIKNLLLTSFLDEVRKDESHQYYILVKKKYVNQLQAQIPFANITFLPFNEPSKFQKKIFGILYGIYEMGCFLTKSCPDQVVFYNRLKHFNTKSWSLRIFGHLMGKLIPKKIKDVIFRSLFKESIYEDMNIDRILITTYHNLYEWQIMASIKTKNIYFFSDGWDAFTKQTNYFIPPKKVFVWSKGMKTSAMKNCHLQCEKIIVTGNSFWNMLKIKKVTNNKIKVLAFDTNLNIYNIVQVLNDIQDLDIKQDKFELSIRCSPINSPEYLKKYNEFKKFIKKENIFYSDDWNSRELTISQVSLVQEYNDQINNHDVFLVFGPTTVIFDILHLKKPVIILSIKGTDDGKWDWTESLQREVLDELKYHPLVKFVNSLDGFINILEEMTKHTNSDNVDDIVINEKKLFQELIN